MGGSILSCSDVIRRTGFIPGQIDDAVIVIICGTKGFSLSLSQGFINSSQLSFGRIQINIKPRLVLRVNVVMPEHVHLLTGEPLRRTPADALKSLKQGVSRRLIAEAEHFWQKRYYDLNIRNHQQFAEKLRYIHRNPVKCGLCERPEDWEWSSFRHYATGIEGRVEIESEWTARRRERAAGRLCLPVELPHSSQNKP